jgi:hypothetical protein
MNGRHYTHGDAGATIFVAPFFDQEFQVEPFE